jgi:hypothetical protein
MLTPEAFLAQHAQDFFGHEWRPRQAVTLPVVVGIVEVVDELVTDVLRVDLSGFTSSGRLERTQHQIALEYEELKRTRTRDHVSFFVSTGRIFSHMGTILQELERLGRAGHFSNQLGANHG